MFASDWSRLYQRVSNWPETPEQAVRLLEEIRQLLGCELTALRLEAAAGESRSGAVVLESVVPVSGAAPQDKLIAWTQAQLAPEEGVQGVSLPQDQALRQLWVVRLDQGSRRGWIAAGSGERVGFGETEKAILLAVALRLEALAAAAELKQQLSQRDRFLSVASHEIKTPLTSIYGLLQLQNRMVKRELEGGAPSSLSSQSADFHKILLRQCERLNELIDGLLDVSRIRTGRFSIDATRTEVVSIVREVISQRLGLAAHEAGVSIELDSPEILEAWVDPVRLEEVVTNLGMNSVRFSPEGGTVWISVSGSSGPPVSSSGSLCIRFRDQGPQVPEADRERIFQPFERAQRTARMGGLGLGLYVSREIARLHGGGVRLLESVPGKGNLWEASFPGQALSKSRAGEA